MWDSYLHVLYILGFVRRFQPMWQVTVNLSCAHTQMATWINLLIIWNHLKIYKHQTVKKNENGKKKKERKNQNTDEKNRRYKASRFKQEKEKTLNLGGELYE